jgi:16S rRNA (cytosine1402-N4)-methyltransferase
VHFTHVPVLLDEVTEWLAPTAPGLLVDVTVGLGGHATALLDRVSGFRLLGLDRDPEAIEGAGKRLQPFSDRVRLVNQAFDQIGELLTETEPPVAILADLGCSSLQLDAPERGFSFLADGPLDMRMGPGGPTAAELVNTAPEDELVRIFRDYGEERRARRVARSIVAARRRASIGTTTELAELVRRAVGSRSDRHIHPATRSFQALRIAVNDELGQLERFVEPAVRALRPKGRLAVISFHSLEDRIVKHEFRRLEGRCVCPPEIPECVCRPERVARVLTSKPVRPSSAELDQNPRARSARLRVAERVGEP